MEIKDLRCVALILRVEKADGGLVTYPDRQATSRENLGCCNILFRRYTIGTAESQTQEGR